MTAVRGPKMRPGMGKIAFEKLKVFFLSNFGSKNAFKKHEK